MTEQGYSMINHDWENTTMKKLIPYKIEKGAVYLKLDLSGGCTKKALEFIIKELQQIHGEM